MYEVIFLFALALAYVIFAVVQDLRTREIANWLNFSLVIFALGFRFFYSLFEKGEFSFFFNGVLGFAVFFILGNLFYYLKVFAGGDAKLFIGFGAILPIFDSIFQNLEFIFNFLIVFLSVGFVYTLLASIFLSVKNFEKFKKEFANQIKKNKFILLSGLFVSLIAFVFGFFDNLIFLFGGFILFLVLLFVYLKSVDESCIVREIDSKNLREGDWLYSDLQFGSKKMKAKWEGVSKKEIKEIQKKFKKVKIRSGVPFSPVFLFSLIILFLFYIFEINLWKFFIF